MEAVVVTERRKTGTSLVGPHRNAKVTGYFERFVDVLQGTREVEAFIQEREKLLRILQSFRLEPEEAEDVLQELLLATLRSQNRGIEIENLGAWYIGTLRYICINHVRGLRKEQEDLKRHMGCWVEKFAEPHRESEVKLDLKQAVRSLPTQARYVLWLKVMGFSPQEIAERSGYCKSSIRKIYGRAVLRLRYRLRERDR